MRAMQCCILMHNFTSLSSSVGKVHKFMNLDLCKHLISLISDLSVGAHANVSTCSSPMNVMAQSTSCMIMALNSSSKINP